MATVEVDELQVQQDRRLRDTVAAWMKNPKAHRKLLEAQKIVDPKAVIPELDEPDPIEAATKPLADEVAALKKQIADDKAEAEKNAKLGEIQRMQTAGWQELKGSRRYTDDGVKAIEAIMEKKGILDPLDAAAIFERDHPPQNPVTPTTGGIGGWNFADMPANTEDSDNKFVESLLKAGKQDIPDGLLMQRVNDTIQDARGHSRR